MKLKIIETGWAGFTGNFGGVEFVDGVSEEVTSLQAQRLANLVQIETLEGKNPSSSQIALDSACVPMSESMPSANIVGDMGGEATAAGAKYTREQLEQIADAKGIEGIRAIAEKMNLKGKSIAGLIESILAQQAGPVVAPAPAAEVAPEAPVAPVEAPAAEQPAA